MGADWSDFWDEEIPRIEFDPERYEKPAEPYYREVELVRIYTARELCVRPYPGHPRGCPNYGKKVGCPPGMPFVEDIIDVRKQTFVIWNRFDLGLHIARMRQRHPEWSERQVRCCRYWQGTARSRLYELLGFFSFEHPGMAIVECPEATGVDVTATMSRIAIDLEWPPMKWAYQVLVAGHRLERRWSHGLKI